MASDKLHLSKKWNTVFIHLAAWSILFIFPLLFIERFGNINRMHNFSLIKFYIQPICIACIFYINYLWLIDKVLFRKKTIRFILYNLLLVIMANVAIYLVHRMVIPESILHQRPTPIPPPRPGFMQWQDSITLVLVVGLSAAIKVTQKWITTEKERKQLEQERTEAELKNLKNQLNPHFLFNTLNNIYSATADFDIALSKVSKLTTGIKYTNNGMDNSTLYEYLKNESWHEIGALTNLNKYNENISALYAKFSTRFKNNFALSLGLRGEYTYAVPSTSSTVITDKQNYFGLFPNANLSMPLNKKQSQMLILGYSRKIQRPWFWALNPFRRPLSEYSYIEGNPRLTPAYTNEVNLTWVFAHKYSLSFGTQLTKDNIQQILVTDPTNPDAIVYRFENMPHMNLWFVNLSVPAQITKWWQMTFNATGINFRSKLSGQPITIQNSIMGNMDNTFTIHKGKKWYIDLGGNYQSPIAVGNIRMGHYYTINGGLKHTFAKDRMTMSIYVNDIFNSGTVRVTGTDPSVTNVSVMQGSFRRLGISLRYNFKAGKKIKVKNVQSGAGDEQSRLSGGASAPGGGN